MDTLFADLVRKHNAVHVQYAGGIGTGNLPKAESYPDRAVWFETANYGWILGPQDADGHRHILVKL